MWKAFIAVTLTLAACGVYAQTDERTKVLDTKPGLDKKITLSVRAGSLREVLNTVEAETGVKLRPEREVSEDKCTICCNDKPARDVLRAIAKCFDLGWTEVEVGSIRYLDLYMDKESKKAMDQRVWDDYSAILGQFDKELKMIEQAVKNATPSEVNPDEIAKLSTDEQDRAWLRYRLTTTPHYRSMVIQFMSLSESQKRDLFQGKVIEISKGSMCDSAKAAYPEAEKYVFWVERSLSGYLLQGAARPAMPEPTWTLLTTALFDDTRYDKAIQDSLDALAKDVALGKDIPAAKPAEASVTTAGAAPPPDLSGNAPLPVPKPGEGSGATPTTMSDGLIPIAAAVDTPIVAQYLSEYDQPGSAVVHSGKAISVLASLCKAHKFTVERNGDFLCAKTVLWHRLRDREVPEATIKRWQRSITGLPYPTFDVTVEMGCMNWGQIRSIIKNSKPWFGIADLSQIAWSEYILKLYDSLKADQKRMLSSGMSVPVSALKPAQQHTFMQAFEVRARPDYTKAKDPSWTQQSSISLEAPAYGELSVYAVAGMQFLDSAGVDIFSNPDGTQNAAPIDQAAMLQRLREALPKAAEDLMTKVLAEHPEIQRKNVSVYSICSQPFVFTIGEDRQIHQLEYCERVL